MKLSGLLWALILGANMDNCFLLRGGGPFDKD